MKEIKRIEPPVLKAHTLVVGKFYNLDPCVSPIPIKKMTTDPKDQFVEEGFCKSCGNYLKLHNEQRMCQPCLQIKKIIH